MEDETRVPEVWERGGPSPNPLGRPKMPKTVREVRELAKEFTPMAMKTLAAVASNPKAPPAARVAASAELLNRAWGRAAASDLEEAQAFVVNLISFANQGEPPLKVIEHDDGDNTSS